MLKIKDNVDLKDLEKFGFKESENKMYYIYEDEESYEILGVSKDCNTIYIQSENSFSIAEEGSLDILFDLIQAGLVEKVIFKEN